MRIGSDADPTERLLLMLAAAQREPALLRRPKQRRWDREPEDFLRFGAGTTVTCLPEETVAEVLFE